MMNIWLSIDDCYSANNNCDGGQGSLPHRLSRISDLVYHNQHGDHDEKKKREQNLIVRSSKTEAEVTNTRRLRSTFCTIEPNY